VSGFRLRLLGRPGFERDGVPVDLGRHKTIALLAYLAVTGQAHRREALATLLWPDYDQARAAAYLRRALWSLKQAVGAEWVLTEQASIGLAAQLELWVDVHQFRQWRSASQRHNHPAEALCDVCQTTLTQAVSLYRGDFLSGFTLPDCPAFDEWQFFQAESLRQELAATLQQLVLGHRRRGEFEAAIACARRQLALDSLHEPAHRQLMALYATAGQRAAALRQYDECARILEAELGAQPDDETKQLYGAIKANQYPDAAAPAAAPQPSREPLPLASARLHGPTPRHNLPAPTTSFVGRTAEVAAVRDLLARPEVRLLTLSGSGGAGKTRLALEVAAGVLASFADRVCFVDLAPLSDPALVAPAIAESLGVRASGVRPVIERLKEYLHGQQALLILDNFEHVLPAAPAVTELLAAAPRLKILVTSRAVLRLGGEWDYALPPLAAPDPNLLPTLDQLATYDAVQLFVERARAVKTSFALSPDNAAAVAAICGKLDGLPLAIELAAARLRVLPPQHILSQLNSRLLLLTGGARDAPARQRTLRDTIDWSYALLTVAEQALFRQLAVFAGGCTLAAAEAVAGAGVPAPDHPGILDGLESLLDKHLLAQADDGADEPRFRMLETIREYGLERLKTSGEAAATRQRHADYFVTLAEAAEPHLYGAGQGAWVRRLEAEHDNLRAALAWAIAHAGATGLRLAGALGWFWHLHGHHREGRDWLLQALDQADAAGVDGDRFRAKALNQAGYLAMFLRDLTRAKALLEQSVVLWRAIGDPYGLAHALCDWGAILGTTTKGHPAQARVLLEESIALFRQLGAKQNLVRAYFWHGLTAAFQHDYAAARASAAESIRLGREVGDISNIGASMGGILAYIAVQEGEYTTAHAYIAEALQMGQEVEDRPGVALLLGSLGSLIYLQGQYAQARPVLEERLRIWRELDNPQGVAWGLNALGYVALRQNDWQQATARFAESLALWRDLGETDGMATCLTGLAEVAIAAGKLARAARLLAAILALLEARNARLEETFWDPLAGYPITGQAVLERHVADMRAVMGAGAFEAAWAAGQALTLEQAIAEALDEGGDRTGPIT
jgi:predicted ATPase/DNA-binding SARP family transcriptional activator